MTQNTYTSQGRKNKIELEDYDFAKDLQNRIHLSKLSVFEVEVLREIVFNSLEFPISELSETLEVSNEKILQALEKLQPTKLFTRYGNDLLIDKEARKYYEIQMGKFGKDAKLGIDHFLSLLSQVAIHHLPSWYALSKTSDDIFEAIIEKNLQTPKTYEKYLVELQYNDECTPLIVEELFSSESFTLEIDYLQEKYSISREYLEELIILLEFNKICFLQYIEDGDRWRGILTPLEEWRSHLEFLKDTMCHSIQESEKIERLHAHDFGFIEDIDQLLAKICEAPQPVKVEECKDGYRLAIPKTSTEFSSEYQSQLLQKVVQLRLAVIEEGVVKVTENTDQWLERSPQEKAMILYFSTINRYRRHQQAEAYTDRDIRELEKSLKRVLKSGWVYTEDFIKGLTAHLSTTCEMTLIKKGRRHSYSRPIYGAKELAFIHEILRHHLFESGMVALGQCNGKDCFMITPFGRLSLGE